MENRGKRDRLSLAGSVRELLHGGHEIDRQFQAIIKETLDNADMIQIKNHFYTYSDCEVFSKEYSMKVPVGNPKRSREEKLLLEEAFHYGLCMFINVLERGTLSIAEQAQRETKAGFAVIKQICSKEVFRAIKRQFKKYEKMSGAMEWDWEWDFEERVNDLLHASFFLARMKRISLTGRAADEDLFALLAGEKKEILKELKQLLAVAMEDFLKNPEIGPLEIKRTALDMEISMGSRYMLGSLEEGLEFCIGDTLYLCSLSDSHVLRWQEIAQLMACYMLGHLGRRKAKAVSERYPRKECLIQRIAIYRARFGEIEYFDISEYNKYNPGKLAKAIERLEDWNLFSPCKNYERGSGRCCKDEPAALDIWDLNVNTALYELPFEVKRDILWIMSQEKITHGYVQEYKTDSDHSMTINLRSCGGVKGRRRGTDGYIIGSWTVRDKNEEEWKIFLRSSRTSRRSNGCLGFNSVTGREAERCRVWHIKLERQELVRILIGGMSLKPIHRFEANYGYYLFGINNDSLDWEEDDAVEETKALLRMLSRPLGGWLKELMIVEDFFKTDTEEIIEKSFYGISFDYDEYSYLWIRDTGQAIVDRESLKACEKGPYESFQNGVYHKILLDILGECACARNEWD